MKNTSRRHYRRQTCLATAQEMRMNIIHQSKCYLHLIVILNNSLLIGTSELVFGTIPSEYTIFW